MITFTEKQIKLSFDNVVEKLYQKENELEEYYSYLKKGLFLKKWNNLSRIGISKGDTAGGEGLENETHV